jgi:dephospho-CoA kinase
VSKRWPDKVIVGLTGNIATGKSAIMAMAAEQGALTVDADKIVHRLLDADAAVQEAVGAAFGDEIRRPAGRVDRPALGAIVFNDPAALRVLERIVHPVVGEIVQAQIDTSQASIVFIEAIKLLEGKLVKICDQIWVSRCPEKTQLERLMVCRGLDAETAATRVKAQSSQEEKVAQADVVIDTQGTLADTRIYFDLAWQRLVDNLAGPMIPAELPPPLRAVAPAGAPSAEQAPRPAESTAPPVKAPPERLSASKASEIRKRLKASKGGPPVGLAALTEPSEAEVEPSASGDILVRRARPPDVPSILLLMQRATDGRVKLKRAELLLTLGERGYLLGQRGTDITAVAGWSSENLIGRIDHFFVYPLEAVEETGRAVLREIIDTANKLICECILAFPAHDGPPAILRLLEAHDFVEVAPERLPAVWRAAVEESQPVNSAIMLKVLRDTRDLPSLQP